MLFIFQQEEPANVLAAPAPASDFFSKRLRLQGAKNTRLRLSSPAFNRFVAKFGNKIYGSFSPKIVGKKMLSKSIFGYFKTKIKGGGAVLVLNGPSIKI